MAQTYINIDKRTDGFLNEIYLFCDQPVTCPKCGARTEIIVECICPEHTQMHKCPCERCSYEFLIEEDLEEII